MSCPAKRTQNREIPLIQTISTDFGSIRLEYLAREFAEQVIVGLQNVFIIFYATQKALIHVDSSMLFFVGRGETLLNKHSESKGYATFGRRWSNMMRFPDVLSSVDVATVEES